MELDADRPRGVLAPVDREYLLGEKEYSRQAEYERKKAIVERVRHAILDFELLAQSEFPDELLDECRGLPDIEPTRESKPPQAFDLEGIHPNIRLGLMEMVAFVFRIEPSMYTLHVLEGTKSGIDRWSGGDVLEDFKIRWTDPESYAERALEDFEEGRELSDKDVRILLQEGKVEPEELAEYVQDQG